MNKLILLILGLTFSNASLSAPDEIPAGNYKLDPAHASLIFKLSHMGYSMYTARFKKFDASLNFNPNDLATSTLTASVDATSLETDFPNPEIVDFNKELQADTWLGTAQYPTFTYRSTSIQMNSTRDGVVSGELTMRGVTKPVQLKVTFNGGYPGMAMDPNARIGFSASGFLLRSDFGITYGIPAPGSNMGVGDQIEVIIEAEFSGPAWTGSEQ